MVARKGDQPAGDAYIIAFRRQMVELAEKIDWPQAQKLYVSHASSQTVDGLLPNLIGEYIRRKRKAGRNDDYVLRLLDIGFGLLPH